MKNWSWEKFQKFVITNKRAFIALASVVVFFTTYALILPAITLVKDKADSTPGIVLDGDGEGEVSRSAGSDEDEGAEDGKWQFEEKLDDKIQIQVATPDGGLPEGVELKVEEVDLGNDLENAILAAAIQEVDAEEDRVRVVKAMDISFWEEDTEVEPTEEIQVAFSSDSFSSLQAPVVVHLLQEEPDEDGNYEVEVLVPIDKEDLDEEDQELEGVVFYRPVNEEAIKVSEEDLEEIIESAEAKENETRASEESAAETAAAAAAPAADAGASATGGGAASGGGAGASSEAGGSAAESSADASNINIEESSAAAVETDSAAESAAASENASGAEDASASGGSESGNTESASASGTSALDNANAATSGSGDSGSTDTESTGSSASTENASGTENASASGSSDTESANTSDSSTSGADSANAGSDASGNGTSASASGTTDSSDSGSNAASVDNADKSGSSSASDSKAESGSGSSSSADASSSSDNSSSSNSGASGNGSNSSSDNSSSSSSDKSSGASSNSASSESGSSSSSASGDSSTSDSKSESGSGSSDKSGSGSESSSGSGSGSSDNGSNSSSSSDNSSSSNSGASDNSSSSSSDNSSSSNSDKSSSSSSNSGSSESGSSSSSASGDSSTSGSKSESGSNSNSGSGSNDKGGSGSESGSASGSGSSDNSSSNSGSNNSSGSDTSSSSSSDKSSSSSSESGSGSSSSDKSGSSSSNSGSGESGSSSSASGESGSSGSKSESGSTSGSGSSDKSSSNSSESGSGSGSNSSSDKSGGSSSNSGSSESGSSSSASGDSSTSGSKSESGSSSSNSGSDSGSTSSSSSSSSASGNSNSSSTNSSSSSSSSSTSDNNDSGSSNSGSGSSGSENGSHSSSSTSDHSNSGEGGSSDTASTRARANSRSKRTEDLREIRFNASQFSVYCLVETETIVRNIEVGARESYTLTTEGDGYFVKLRYTSKAAIPEGAELVVSEIGEGTEEYEEYYAQAQAQMLATATASNVQKQVSSARFFDITIYDAEGEKIEPKAPVEVQIFYDDTFGEDNDNISMIHFGENKTEVIESEIRASSRVDEDGEEYLAENAENELNGTDNDIDAESGSGETEDGAISYAASTYTGTAAVEEDALTFVSDSFSVYGVVETTTITSYFLNTEGENYRVTLTYGPEARIPKDAVLSVTEITEATDPEAYAWCLQQAAASLAVNTGTGSETDADSLAVQSDLAYDAAQIETSQYGLAESGLAQDAAAQSGMAQADATQFETAQDTAAAQSELASGEAPELRFGRFFDINILSGGEKIEPKAPVEVKIEYAEGYAEDLQETGKVCAVHFTEDPAEAPEVIQIDTLGMEQLDEAVFEADSFTIYGIVGTVKTKTTVQDDTEGVSLQELLKKAYEETSGNSEILVELQRDYTENIIIPDSYKVIIDLNGHTLRPDGTGASGTVNHFTVFGDLTIRDSSASNDSTGTDGTASPNTDLSNTDTNTGSTDDNNTSGNTDNTNAENNTNDTNDTNTDTNSNSSTDNATATTDADNNNSDNNASDANDTGSNTNDNNSGTDDSTTTTTLSPSGGLDGTGVSNARAVDVRTWGRFTLESGCIENYSVSGNGAAVLVENNAKFRMEGGILRGNEAAGYGGAVFISNYDNEERAELVGGSMQGNAAVSGGGLAYSVVSIPIRLGGVTISGNTASENGGGIYVDPSVEMEINGTQVLNNTAALSGGGIYFAMDNLESGTLSLAIGTGSAVSGNTAETENGGGIYCRGTATLSISGSVSENKAKADGGGIYFRKSSSLHLDGGSLSGNSTEASGGGAYFYAIKNDVVMENGSRVSDNTAAVNGGGLHCRDGNASNVFSVEIKTGSALSGNHANGQGGGAYLPNYSALTVSGAEISGNEAGSQGGGAYLNSYSNVSFSDKALLKDNRAGSLRGANGGALYLLYYSTLTMSDTVVEGNSSSYYGGICMYDGNQDHMATARITNTVFRNNRSILGGTGGFYFGGGNLYMKDVEFSGNEGGEGGGFYANAWYGELENITAYENTANGSGGGFYLNLRDGYLKDSEIYKNVSKSSGGGFCIGEMRDGIVENIKCYSNQGVSGGGYYAAFWSGTFKNMEVYGNKATSHGGGAYLSTYNAYATSITFDGGSYHDNQTGNCGGGIYIYYWSSTGENWDKWHFKGLKIYKNSANSSGGGIYGSSFALEKSEKDSSEENDGSLEEECEIYENTANSNGGGIYLDNGYETETWLESGVIRNNYAKGSGGGVFGIYSRLTLHLAGTRILDNQAASEAGGVYLYACNADMTGGEISGNTASNNGGGIRQYRGDFALTGGIIRDNKTTGNGQDYYYDDTDYGNYTLAAASGLGGGTGWLKESDGTVLKGEVSGAERIYLTFLHDAEGDVARLTLDRQGEGKNYSSIQAAIQAASDARATNGNATVTLLKDTQESVVVKKGMDLTLDLAGYSIRGKESSVIEVQYGGKLTLKDSSEEQTGTLCYGIGKKVPYGSSYKWWGGGIYCAGTVVMEGGTVSYNRNHGIYLSAGADFTLAGGCVENQKNYGIYTYRTDAEAADSDLENRPGNENGQKGLPYYGSQTAFTMTGGSIRNNTSGGIYVGSLSPQILLKGGEISNNTGYGMYMDSGKLTMTGGEISANATTGSYTGAGIWMSSVTATITGGRISNNGNATSTANGGGIYLNSSSTLKLKGGEITGNAANKGGGIYLNNSYCYLEEFTGGKLYGNSAKQGGADIYVNDNIPLKNVNVLPADGMEVAGLDAWYDEVNSRVYDKSAITKAEDGTERVSLSGTAPFGLRAIAYNSQGDAAKIGNVKYKSVQEAILAAAAVTQSGNGGNNENENESGSTDSTIYLLRDVQENLTVSNDNANIVLDLNGWTLSALGSPAITLNGGNLEVRNTSDDTEKNPQEDGGKIQPMEGNTNARGIQVSSGDLTLDNVEIRGFHTAAHGAGIYAYPASNDETISIRIALRNHARITDCKSSGSSYGGGIYAEKRVVKQTLKMNLENASISDCEGWLGGGIYVNNAVDVSISDGAISGCVAKHRGGGIYMDSNSILDVARSSITNCKAEAAHGGGVYSTNGSNLAFSNGTVISGCEAKDCGGGIFVQHQGKGETLKIENCVLSGNTTVNYGGGLYMYDNNVEMDHVILTGSTFQGNSSTASIGGGAFFGCGGDAYEAELQFYGNVFQGNTALKSSGGGMYFSYSKGADGTPATLGKPGTDASGLPADGAEGTSGTADGTQDAGNTADSTQNASDTNAEQDEPAAAESDTESASQQDASDTTESTGTLHPANGNIFLENQAYDYGGLYVADRSVRIYGAAVKDNRAIRSTGGICIEVGADKDVTVYGCEIAGNQSGDDWSGYIGGMNLRGMAEKTIDRCSIHDNRTFDYAAGMWISGGSVTMDDVHVLRNTVYATTGGSPRAAGIYLTTSGQMDNKFTNCEVSENMCSGYGAGLYIYYPDGLGLVMENCLVQNNTARGGSYGGICGDRHGHYHDILLTLRGENIISGNRAQAGSGGGIGGSMEVIMEKGSKVRITDNEARDYGGGIYLGGGLTIDADADVEIANNKAITYHGGGIYFYNGKSNYTELTPRVLSGGKIYGNTANYGGGIFNNDVYRETWLSGVEIYGNTANYGGAVYNNQKVALRMQAGAVRANTAQKDGGAFYNNSADPDYPLEISGGEVSGNQSVNGNGGGMYNVSGARFILSADSAGVSVYDNSARIGQDIYSNYGNGARVDILAASEMSLADGRAVLGWLDETMDNVLTNKVTGRLSRVYALTLRYRQDSGIVARIAIDNERIATSSNIDAGAVREFPSVQSAVDWAATQNWNELPVIKMVADSRESVSIPSGLRAALDLAGHTLTGVNTAITNYGELTIRDSSANAGNGTAETAGDNTDGSGSVDGSPEGTSDTGDTSSIDTNAENTNTGTGIITGSGATYGGGIRVASGTVTMEGGTITGCYAVNGGAGVAADGGTFILKGGEISGNECSNGSAVYVRQASGKFVMSGGRISGNNATGSGAVFNETGKTIINGGEISGNTVTNYGGGIYVSSGTVQVVGTAAQQPVITGNYANWRGGGIFLSSGTMTLENVQITKNSVNQTAYSTVYERSGGGIYVNGGILNLSEGVLITGNSAFRGGGIYTSSGVTNMVGGLITGNSANRGGGVAQYPRSRSEFNLMGGAVYGNRSTLYSSGNDFYSQFEEAGNYDDVGQGSRPYLTLMAASQMEVEPYNVWKNDTYEGRNRTGEKVFDPDGQNDGQYITTNIIQSSNLQLTAAHYDTEVSSVYAMDFNVTSLVFESITDGLSATKSDGLVTAREAMETEGIGSLSGNTYKDKNGTDQQYILMPDGKEYEQDQAYHWDGGMDKSREGNGLVRSYDQITYALKATMQKDGITLTEGDTQTYQNETVHLWIEAELPAEVEDASLALDTSTGLKSSMTSYRTDENGATVQVVRGYWEVSTAPGGTAQKNVYVNVFGMKNGATLKPKFTMWCERKAEDEENNLLNKPELSAPIETVSATGRYNLEINQNPALSYTGYFDVESRMEVSKADYDKYQAAEDKSDMAKIVYGTILGYGVTAEMYNSGSDIRGLEIPTGDVKFNINFKGSLYLDGEPVGDAGGKAPYIWAYKENMDGIYGRAPGSSSNAVSMDWNDVDDKSTERYTRYAYQAAPYNTGGGGNACYAGGGWVITADEDGAASRLSTRISGYAFNPSYNDSNPTSYAGGYNNASSGALSPSNVKAFSAGYVQVLFEVDPNAEELKGKSGFLQVGMHAAVSDLEVTTASGEKMNKRPSEKDGAGALENYYGNAKEALEHAVNEEFYGDNYKFDAVELYIGAGDANVDQLTKSNYFTLGNNWDKTFSRNSGSSGDGNIPIGSTVYAVSGLSYTSKAIDTSDKASGEYYIEPENYNTQSDNYIEYNYLTAFDLIQCFDGEAFQPVGTKEEIINQRFNNGSSEKTTYIGGETKETSSIIITTSESEAEGLWATYRADGKTSARTLSYTLTVLYGAKEDGSNWTPGTNHYSEFSKNGAGGAAEMQEYGAGALNPDYDGLTFYPSMDALREAQPDAKCVAVLYEFRNCCIRTNRGMNVYTRMDIPDDFMLTGSTYCITNQARIWTSYRKYYKLEAETAKEDFEKLSEAAKLHTYERYSGEGDPKSGTNAQNVTSKTYIKTEYRNGQMVAGTHSGYLNGNSLLLHTLDTTIRLENTDYTVGSNNLRLIYNIQDGERIAGFKVIPTVFISSEAKSSLQVTDGSIKTKVTIRITLPRKLHYQEGSLRFDYNAAGCQYKEGELLWTVTPPADNSTEDHVLLLETYLTDTDKGLPSFTYSTLIGDLTLDDANDVVNAEVLTSVAEIEAEYQEVSRSAAPMHSSSYSISISKTGYEGVLETGGREVEEVGEDLYFYLWYFNNNDRIISNVQITDVLPYNWDDRDNRTKRKTDFTGGYRIKELSLNFANEADMKQYQTVGSGGTLALLAKQHQPVTSQDKTNLLKALTETGETVKAIEGVTEKVDDKNYIISYTFPGGIESSPAGSGETGSETGGVTGAKAFSNRGLQAHLTDSGDGSGSSHDRKPWTTYAEDDFAYALLANVPQVSSKSSLVIGITLSPLEKGVNTATGGEKYTPILDNEGRTQLGGSTYYNDFQFHSSGTNPVDSNLYSSSIKDRTISGFAFMDQNQDGDAKGDRRIAGLQVTLYKVKTDGDGVYLEANPESIVPGMHVEPVYTDEKGEYKFSNLAYGTYQVHFNENKGGNGSGNSGENGNNGENGNGGSGNSNADEARSYAIQPRSGETLTEAQQHPISFGELSATTQDTSALSDKNRTKGVYDKTNGKTFRIASSSNIVLRESFETATEEQLYWNAGLYYIEAKVEKEWKDMPMAVPEGVTVSLVLQDQSGNAGMGDGETGNAGTGNTGSSNGSGTGGGRDANNANTGSGSNTNAVSVHKDNIDSFSSLTYLYEMTQQNDTGRTVKIEKYSNASGGGSGTSEDATVVTQDATDSQGAKDTQGLKDIRWTSPSFNLQAETAQGRILYVLTEEIKEKQEEGQKDAAGGDQSTKFTLQDLPFDFKTTYPTPKADANGITTYKAVNQVPLNLVQFRKVAAETVGEPPKPTSMIEYLPNAQFALGTEAPGSSNSASALRFKKDGDGSYHLAYEGQSNNDTLTSAANGQLRIDGLPIGTYYLWETKAPDGRNLPAGYWKLDIADGNIVTVTAMHMSSTDPVANGILKAIDGDSVKNRRDELVDSYYIPNKSGYALPSSGGTGTMPYTAAGLLLIGSALGYGLYRRKRRKADAA